MVHRQDGDFLLVANMETSLDSTASTQSQPSAPPLDPFGFVQRRLPWIVAGIFLLIYGLTLGRWVSYQGLSTLARAAGWDWQLAYHAPLHYLLTYPARWLPAGWQVIALNAFSMACSVLTLAILARSVSILPHDRTRDQRQLLRNEFSLLGIPGAWLPPIFAALVCGLQLTFWQHSTVSTFEALDLLLFAYCTRCLLEFRLDGRDSWLYRMALVLGLGMTSNFAMIGFLPAFLIALIWMKKRSFFNLRFLLRMALLAFAGLLLYLVLPAINSASPLADQSFWEALKINFGYQKSQLVGFPRYVILVVGLTSILPIAFIGIRWPNTMGDISAMGNALTNVMTHVIHLVFMAACLYVAFDPPFSPRQLSPSGAPMLPFYYLGALSVGYFAGYFMLVFGSLTFKPWQRYRELRKILNMAMIALVWLAAIAVPAGLAVKNLPEVRKTASPHLPRMAALAVNSLPESGGVVLSDDPFRLYTVYHELDRKGLLDRFILIDTAAMHNPLYHRSMRARHGEQWSIDPANLPVKKLVDTGTILDIILNASTRQRLFYLHPSFGYYFEYFYLEPLNLVYEMKRYPANSLTSPVLTKDQLASNERFWKQLIASELPALKQPSIIDLPKARQKSVRRNPSTFSAAAMYSRSLNWIGVEAQRAGELNQAQQYFHAALQLNPDNPAAFVNQEYNARLRAGKTEPAPASAAATNRVAAYNGNWQRIMTFHGPVDEPHVAFVNAQLFAGRRFFRQAAQSLARASELMPESLELRIALSGMLVSAGRSDAALELIKQIRSDPKNAAMTQPFHMLLLQNEAWAHVFKDDLPAAEKVLHAAELKYPADETPLSTLTEIYFKIGRTSNAVALIERELTRTPDNLSALVNLAAVRIQDQDYNGALPLLNRALKIEPDNGYALINRAIAHLHTGRLDESRADYDALKRKMMNIPHQVHYGLAEVAWRKKQYKVALQHYEDYLKVAPPDTAEHREVQQRIKRIKAGSV
jgi:tetratricopeptide (TPR) repeat protein